MSNTNRYLGLLVYHPQSNITARMLGRLLGLKSIRLDKSIIKLAKKYPIKIRYGNSHEEQKNDTEFNSVDTIRYASNSTLFSTFCKNNEIFSPYYTRFNVDKIPPFPFLLRDRYHMAGKDIRIVEAAKNFANLYPDDLSDRFWVPFIKTEYELRLHYVLGDIVRVFVKRPGENSDINFPIRTTHYGWRYHLRVSNDKYKKARDVGVHLAELMELKFGAIDMAWAPDEKKYIIWEVNTAPGLNENTAQVYAERLKEVI